MALLKFVCTKCRKEFEELIFGERKPECPNCGSNDTERLYTGKCYSGKNGNSGCTGSCSTCKGCCH